MPRRRGSKYGPLADYLATLPAELAAVTLAFVDVERLVRRPLPASAWLPAWRMHDQQAALWRTAGWWPRSVARVDAGMTVTFVRLAARPAEPPPHDAE